MPAQAAVKVASSPTPAVATASQVSVPKANTPTGPVHIVTSGESLYFIARKYHVEPSTIVKANDLSSMDKIFIGQKLIIPGGQQPNEPITTASISKPKAAPVVAPAVAAKPAPASVPKPVAEPKTVASAPAVTEVAPIKAQPADGKFRWPVSGTVITDFAESRSGINIAAQEGTAVRAADSGTVIYTGSAVQGYGNLVLIKHANGYVSAYAHLKDITVTKGLEVNRGEAIGTTGMTGGVSRPQLHFELRKGATPVDPTPLLAG